MFKCISAIQFKGKHVFLTIDKTLSKLTPLTVFYHKPTYLEDKLLEQNSNRFIFLKDPVFYWVKCFGWILNTLALEVIRVRTTEKNLSVLQGYTIITTQRFKNCQQSRNYQQKSFNAIIITLA